MKRGEERRDLAASGKSTGFSNFVVERSWRVRGLRFALAAITET